MPPPFFVIKDEACRHNPDTLHPFDVRFFAIMPIGVLLNFGFKF